MDKKQKKVFIFDDNEEILEICSIILEDLGFEVKSSSSAHNLEQQLQSFLPDIIFMDNWLSDITGIEATKIIKSNNVLRDIPVIYFTANSNITELAAEAGADDYLAKPFDIHDFEAMAMKYGNM